MKKIFIFLLLILCCFANFTFTKIQPVQASTSIFAKIEKANTFLYSSPINNTQNQLFEIPQTYFVELLANAEDAENKFYSARYMDITGYVKKDEVTAVQGTPTTPFANNINFRIFSLNGLDLKSSPTNATPFNKIVTVPYLCNNLIYYGCINGQQMIPEKSSTWFYCKYLDGSNSYFGYLYSDLCDSLTTIYPNTETLPAFEGELFQTTQIEQVSTPEKNISNSSKVIIIIAVSTPCLVALYLIFKPTRLSEKAPPKKHNKIKRLKRAEFYELDD